MAKTDGDIVFKDEAVIKVPFLQKRHAEQHKRSPMQISGHQKIPPAHSNAF